MIVGFPAWATYKDSNLHNRAFSSVRCCPSIVGSTESGCSGEWLKSELLCLTETT